MPKIAAAILAGLVIAILVLVVGLVRMTKFYANQPSTTETDKWGKLVTIAGLDRDEIYVEAGESRGFELKLQRPLLKDEAIVVLGRGGQKTGVFGEISWSSKNNIAKSVVTFGKAGSVSEICFSVVQTPAGKIVDSPDCVRVIFTKSDPEYGLPGEGGPLVARLKFCKKLIFCYISIVHY